MKRATALLKSGNVYIQSYSETTTTGLWIADGPVYVAAIDAPAQIARYVRDALAHSRRGIPRPAQTEWKAIQAPMLKATGTRTWAAMARGSRGVGVKCDDDSIVTITPSANYENKGGTDLDERALKSELWADDIGEKLIAAFNASS